MLSGRDEKPKRLSELTFQACSYCEGFRFWEGKRDDRISIFFNPIEYQRKNARFLPVVIYSAGGGISSGRFPTYTEFNGILRIECSECGKRLDQCEQEAMIRKAVGYVVRQG